MAEQKPKPFTLTAPDGRVFLAMTYADLLRLTAPAFLLAPTAHGESKGRDEGSAR
jgi:hypothetical protein